MSLIKIKRGLRSNVPASNSAGELAFAMDTKELLIGNGSGMPNTLLVKKNNFDAVTNPVASSDILQGYTVGSIWVNTLIKKYYACVDNSQGAAVWNELSLSSLVSGNLTESTSSVLNITGGSGAVIGSGTSIQVKQASNTQSGFLSNSDWAIFSGKSLVTASATNGNIRVNGSELAVYTAVKDNFVAVTAPTVTDDANQGYSVGSTWVDILLQRQYTCVKSTVGAAVWLLVASASGVPTPKISIQGCRLRWVSITQVNLQVGAINLYGNSYELSAEIPITWDNLAVGSNKTADTWYYTYIKVVSGVITPYVSTSTPNRDAYGNTITDASLGAAKYHSTHGRFVGSFRTNSTQSIVNFVSLSGWVQYVGQGYGYILQGGSSQTRVAVNCRAAVPFTSGVTSVYFQSASGNGQKYVGDNLADIVTFIAGGAGEVTLPVTNNSVYYRVQNSGNSLNLGIHGYYEET